MAFPWILSNSLALSSPSTCNFPPWTLPKFQFHPSTRSVNCRCKCGLSAEVDFKFVYHDALDFSGIDTSHARAARVGFCSQIPVFRHFRLLELREKYRVPRNLLVMPMGIKRIVSLPTMWQDRHIYEKKCGRPCWSCRAIGFYACKLCEGNGTVNWSPLYDPVFINPCVCPTCDGFKVQHCLNCLGYGSA